MAAKVRHFVETAKEISRKIGLVGKKNPRASQREDIPLDTLGMPVYSGIYSQ